MDLFYLLVVAAFFVTAIAYVFFLENLQGEDHE